MLFEARGQFRDAEASYKVGELRKRAAIKPILAGSNPPSESSLVLAVDFTVLSQARMKARQGRLAEAEVDARRALLSRLKDQGKYNAVTPRFIMGLADILVEQGRYRRSRASWRAWRSRSTRPSALPSDRRHRRPAAVAARRHPEPAAQGSGKRSRSMPRSTRRSRIGSRSGGRRSNSTAGAFPRSTPPARSTPASPRPKQLREERRLRGSARTISIPRSARGTLAIGLMRAGRDQRCDPRIQGGDSGPDGVLARERRRRRHHGRRGAQPAPAEHRRSLYRHACARARTRPAMSAVETFSLADAIRGHSVQQALAASSARALRRIRRWPNSSARNRISASRSMRNSARSTTCLSLPSGERDEKGVQAINASINTLRADRDKARQEISQRFPTYADLIDRRSRHRSTRSRRRLTDGEAMLSFYFGQTSSFVWAVPKRRPGRVRRDQGDQRRHRKQGTQAARGAGAAGGDDLGHSAVRSQARATSSIALLLKPVESGWKPAKNLIVVTNGALGLLPLSLLPTAPAEVEADDDPLFASYRNVPWLARTHAVTIGAVGGGAAHACGNCRPASPTRGELIAFGDPYFSKEQEAEADKRRQASGSPMPPATRRAACR